MELSIDNITIKYYGCCIYSNGDDGGGWKEAKKNISVLRNANMELLSQDIKDCSTLSTFKSFYLKFQHFNNI